MLLVSGCGRIRTTAAMIPTENHDNRPAPALLHTTELNQHILTTIQDVQIAGTDANQAVWTANTLIIDIVRLVKSTQYGSTLHLNKAEKSFNEVKKATSVVNKSVDQALTMLGRAITSVMAEKSSKGNSLANLIYPRLHELTKHLTDAQKLVQKVHEEVQLYYKESIVARKTRTRAEDFSKIHLASVNNCQRIGYIDNHIENCCKKLKRYIELYCK
ncbi:MULTISPECIES: hypothetical protein [unclassified Candidatus Cardinium]|uniref:hypothetical protein n=1 Tax=unclassified Candidatus Cardinium TaxID=2641185 RepID=UPI001FB5209E|nr:MULTISPECIES: hypothetical protein [unclassified Candidatus Cardinium]